MSSLPTATVLPRPTKRRAWLRLGPLSWLVSPLLVLLAWAWLAQSGRYSEQLLVPPAVVWDTFKDLIITKAVFFPVALATSEGIKAIPRSYFEVGRIYRLPLRHLLLDIAFPAAAPPILTGIRIGLSRAWMVLVAAELLAADSGLGQMIEMARQMMRIDIVMVGVVVIGVIGFTLDYGFRLLEKRLFRWKTR